MTGRPERTEVDAYYFTYVDKVEGDNPLATMRRQFDELLPKLAAVSEEQSLYRYAPGKWSIRQVLNHVSDTERAFAFRALWFARGFESPLPGYDQDTAVAGAEADGVSWAAHVGEFRAVRLSSIALFENLPQNAWMRSGIASEKLFTVRALAYLIPGHVAHHAGILRELYRLEG